MIDFTPNLAPTSKDQKGRMISNTQQTVMSTAVCEVFNFSDGQIDKLKSAEPKLQPSKQLLQKSKSTALVAQKDGRRDSIVHQVDLYMTSEDQNQVTAQQRQLKFLASMRRYYGKDTAMCRLRPRSIPRSSARQPTTLPAIVTAEQPHRRSKKRHSNSSPAVMTHRPANHRNVTSKFGADSKQLVLESTSTNFHNDLDDLRSGIATRGESRQSCTTPSSSESDDSAVSLEGDNNETPWPPNGDWHETKSSPENDNDTTLPPKDHFPLLFDIHTQQREETMSIYQVTKMRLKKLRELRLEKNDRLEDTSGHTDGSEDIFLSSHKMKGSELSNAETYQEHRRRQSEANTLVRNKVRVASHEKKTPLKGSSTKLIEAKSKATASSPDQKKMFLESDYDQFSHRKLKKIVAPSERARTRTQSRNIISKQYEKREAMQFIKVKISKDEELRPVESDTSVSDGSGHTTPRTDMDIDG